MYFADLCVGQSRFMPPSAVEIALTTPDAATAIREIRTTHPTLLVGAGTVLSSYDVTASVKAGAMFVVSPGHAPDVLDAARHALLLAIPGVLTPTEVQRALGVAPLLKLFPAGLGGPELLRALRGPFPDVRFMPTGGVRLSLSLSCNINACPSR